MGTVFERETERLKQRLLQIAEIAETQLRGAVRAVITRDIALANDVIALDRKVDNEEVALEEDCLKLLALHQPVANDLRLIIAALKINNDLERIGDLASNIAKCCKNLAALPEIPTPERIQDMGKKTKLMFKKSLLAFLELDTELARQALETDDEIDQANREVRTWVIEQIQLTPHRADELLLLLAVAKSLERIADQASNIAEDVVYLLEGDIIRHGRNRTRGKLTAV